MASDSIFLIDIDKILRDKAGRKAKRIPRFFSLLTLFHRSEILLTEKAVGQNLFSLSYCSYPPIFLN